MRSVFTKRFQKEKRRRRSCSLLSPQHLLFSVTIPQWGQFRCYSSWLCGPFAISLIPITTVLVLGKVMSSSPGFEIAISVIMAVLLAEVAVVFVLVTFPCSVAGNSA